MKHLSIQEFFSSDSAPIRTVGDSLSNYSTKASTSLESLLWILLPVIAIITFLSILALCRILRQRRAIAIYRNRSTDQLRFIRNLLDLCYTYSDSPSVFIEKFKDKVNIRELKSYELIEKLENCPSVLKEDERLLCQLLDAGFTHRELCVIFNLKKTSNLYTNHHRIQQKLKGDKSQKPPIVKKP